MARGETWLGYAFVSRDFHPYLLPVRLAQQILTCVNRRTALSVVSFLGERRVHGVWRRHGDGCDRAKMTWERMTEGLQKSGKLANGRGIRPAFNDGLCAFIPNDIIEMIGVMEIGMRFFEVRHCRTALPHHRTALFEEFFVVARGPRNMVPRPAAKAAQPSLELPAQAGAQQDLPGARPFPHYVADG